MRHPPRSFRMDSSICSGFLFVSVCVHAEGFKYTGSGACSATPCHGSAKPKNAGLTQSNEFTIWSQKDNHAKAFEALYSDDAQAIAKAMGLGEAAKAEKCLTCHTTGDGSRTGMGGVAYKDKALQGTKYDVEEGVSCNACHGPAGKWLDPHTKQGWTTEQRKANPDKAKLFKALGLYDTKPVMARANNCVSCHLRIDVKMIEAAHPPLYFELSTNSENMPPHWKDKGAYLRPKLWAAGQTAALRESLRQLAERAEGKADEDLIAEAADQAKAHATVLRHVLPVGPAKTVNDVLSAVGGAGEDAGKLAAAGKDGAAKITGIESEIEKLSFDAAKTKDAINKVAGDLSGMDLDFVGAEQTLYAIDVMVATLADNEIVDDEFDEAMESLWEELDEDELDVDKAKAGLKKVAGIAAGLK